MDEPCHSFLEQSQGNQNKPWEPNENPLCISVKHDFDEDEVKISVEKKMRGTPIMLKNFQPEKAYDEPLQLCGKKLKDLWEMCRKKTIPSEFHQFYKSLKGFPPLPDDAIGDQDLEDDVDVPDDPQTDLEERQLSERP